MLNSFPVAAIIGLILGFFSALGIGGGTLLILWLTLALNMDNNTARAINLMFFLTTALTVNIFRLRQKTIRAKKLLPAVLAGSILAFLVSFARDFVDIILLQKAFGILLLITGIKELCYRPRKAK